MHLRWLIDLVFNFLLFLNKNEWLLWVSVYLSISKVITLHEYIDNCLPCFIFKWHSCFPLASVHIRPLSSSSQGRSKYENPFAARLNIVCANHSMFCAMNYSQPRALNHQNSRNILNPNTQTIKTGLCHVNTFSLQ